jgi:hypothetical protein
MFSKINKINMVKSMEIITLNNYFCNCLNMIFKVNRKVKRFIIIMLQGNADPASIKPEMISYSVCQAFFEHQR